MGKDGCALKGSGASGQRSVHLLWEVFGFRGGEGRIQQETLIKPSCPPPLPRDQRGWGLGVACEDCNAGGLHSHDRAALGLLLLESGGEQIRLAGQV